MDTPSKLDPLSEDGLQPLSCGGEIEIKDLSFSYPSRRSIKVLKGLNLTIPAGKTMALVGASGCGKSTLVGLLERWYERDSGAIELDGVDITQCNTKWLRSQIGLVQQVMFAIRSLSYMISDIFTGTCLVPRHSLSKCCEWIRGLPENAPRERTIEFGPASVSNQLCSRLYFRASQCKHFITKRKIFADSLLSRAMTRK